MKSESVSWSKGITLVCMKCSKAISPELLKEEGHPGEKLRDYLKAAFKESGDSKNIRVVMSGCLSVCLKDTQAVAFLSRQGESEVWSLHPELEKEELLGKLRQKL